MTLIGKILESEREKKNMGFLKLAGWSGFSSLEISLASTADAHRDCSRETNIESVARLLQQSAYVLAQFD